MANVKVIAKQGQTVMTISGHASKKVKPTRASVQIYISSRGQSEEKVKQKHSVILQQVNQIMASYGKSIKLISQSSNTGHQYDYDAKPRRIIGFTVDSYIVVKIKEIERVTRFVGEILKLDNEQLSLGGVDFYLDKKSLEQEKTAMTTRAGENALKNARQTAGAFGLKMSEIICIAEGSGGGGGGGGYQMMERGLAASSLAAAAPRSSSAGNDSTFSISPGVVKVSGNVVMTVLLDPFPGWARDGNKN